MGNIAIVYQIGIADARKKCMRLKKKLQVEFDWIFDEIMG